MQEVQKLADSCMLYQKYCAINLSVDAADMESAWNKALVDTDLAKAADIFGRVVSDVLRRRELRNQSVATKVGHVLTKLYPMMRVVLGVFQAATDVYLPVCLMGLTVFEGGSVSSSESDRQWTCDVVTGSLIKRQP